MTFFYSIVGMLLFSSIVLVNKFVILFAYNGNIIKNPEYIDSESQQIDQFFLSVLSRDKDYGNGSELCLNLKKEFVYSGLSKLNQSEYLLDGFTKSSHPDLINSCILSDGNHRILIKKKTNLPITYSFNSCLLKNALLCQFEKEGD